MFATQDFGNFMMYLCKRWCGAAVMLLTCLLAKAQPHTEIDLDKDKPKEYSNRKLASEKTGEKKFTLPRRLYHNTVTHYNYYFNANMKLNEVMEKAKMSFKDDYDRLLPFYNYTLEGTAQQKNDLDSVIYKSTAGILLHDLRNAWVDNMYMILGRAYLLRKDFDSAVGCFQYVNYVYAPKDDGYDIPLGSNASGTNGVFTISTKESKSILKKMTSRPPSRNESFIWIIRSYLEQDMMGEAAGLLGILRNDPNFPKRLHDDLHEMTAYWFYKQQMYDSAADHLKQCMGTTQNKMEQARREYLAAQLFQLSRQDSAAISMYEKSISHTIDPLMEIYARLNIVSLAAGSKKDALQENLKQLLKLAKKDKYDTYRDIIYYSAAQLELKRDSLNAAKDLLLKSVKYSVDNPKQKSLSFFMLGDISYVQKDYVASSNFYDSVDVATLQRIAEDDSSRLSLRKPALKIIAGNIITIQKQDSLQRIANMPEAERIAFVKKLSKQLRKAKGIKEQDESIPDNAAYAASNNKGTDIFGDTKGDFYFSNASLKSKGLSDFKSRWGKRPNVDNWRRESSISKSMPKNKVGGDLTTVDVDDAGGPTLALDDTKSMKLGDKRASEEEAAAEDDITFEGLMSRLPLTQERKDASNEKIETALFSNGETFQNKLEDYPASIDAYEELLRRFKNAKQKDQALFSLIYCYTKVGLIAKADSARKALQEGFPDSDLAKKMKGEVKQDNKKDDAATKKYEAIYDLFIEGQFEKAIQEKQKADAQYSNNYWTPQLLFIESIYYIKQKQDSIAIASLQQLASKFSQSPLAEKAKTMIDVLKRRKEIESYLTSLDVERNEDAPNKNVDLNPVTSVTKQPEIKAIDTNSIKQPTKIVAAPTVTAPVAQPAANDKFSFVPTDAQYVMLILDKVDRVFVSETKSAFQRHNSDYFYNKKIGLSPMQLNEQYNLLLIGPFDNAAAAVEYLDKIKPQTTTRILPWLKPEKYSFSIISNNNLTLLTGNKDLPSYIGLLKQALPGKF